MLNNKKTLFLGGLHSRVKIGIKYRRKQMMNSNFCEAVEKIT